MGDGKERKRSLIQRENEKKSNFAGEDNNLTYPMRKQKYITKKKKNL